MRRRLNRTWSPLLAAAGTLLVVGCGRGPQLASPPAGTLRAELTFCRKLDTAGDRRLGTGERFTMGEKREVVACVDFRDATPGRLEAIHLVWLDPDGKEMFRKYAEVVVRPDGERFTAEVDWRKAEDLIRHDLAPQTVDVPGFTLVTRLGIAPDKGRQPGRYALHVYWHRKLMLAGGFELLTAPDYVRAGEAGAAALDLDLAFCGGLDADGECSVTQTEFQIGRQREITARFALNRAELDRPYALGLAWLDPGGKQVFRKDAEVSVRAAGGSYEARVCWSKDRELDGCVEEIQRVQSPGFRLTSKLGIAPDKKRDPGRYTLRVLLADETLLERAVELQAPAPAPPDKGKPAGRKSSGKTSGKKTRKVGES